MFLFSLWYIYSKKVPFAATKTLWVELLMLMNFTIVDAYVCIEECIVSFILIAVAVVVSLFVVVLYFEFLYFPRIGMCTYIPTL